MVARQQQHAMPRAVGTVVERGSVRPEGLQARLQRDATDAGSPSGSGLEDDRRRAVELGADDTDPDAS
jgi:hypothetical protein